MCRVFVDDEEVFGERPIRGMYLAHRLDITAQLARAAAKASCQLSILLFPPDHVGCVDKGWACAFLNFKMGQTSSSSLCEQCGWRHACRGQGGDHMIAKGVTAQFVEGWDWILPVPDRNTGIWDNVELCFSGPASLQVPASLTRSTPACRLPLTLPGCGACPRAGALRTEDQRRPVHAGRLGICLARGAG